MNGTEFYAATVDQAVEKAASSLGVDKSQLVYSVLDSGNAGFLGVGARDARIEVENAPPTEEEQTTGAAADREEPNSEEPVGQEDLEVVPESPEATASLAEDQESVESPQDTRQAPESLIYAAKRFVEDTARQMGLTARVDAYDAGDVVAVDVASEETGLFIGQKGETIDSLQYLTNVAVYKDRDFVKKIVLDAEGYRQRRVEAIQGMAHRAARRAAREGRTVELAPMSSTERRVVHLYLKDNPSVTTHSEGREETRKVIVAPQ